jgi:TonB family protein
MKITMRILLSFLILLAAGEGNFVRAQQNETVKDDDINAIDFEDLLYNPHGLVAAIEGTVVVQAKLDAIGHVASAEAISGGYPFLQDCLENVKKMRFRPNAPKTITIVYHFTLLEGRCIKGSSVFSLGRGNFATIVGCVPVIQ